MSPCWAGPSDHLRRLSVRRQKSFRNAWTRACHGLSLGSKVAAIACWVAWGRKCARLRPAQWLWGDAHMMTLPPHTGADLPAQARFSDEITFEMLSTAEGAPRGAAAFRAVVPHGYTPDGRRSRTFLDSLEEIVDGVELGRPGFGAMASAIRKARAFSSHVLRLMPADVPQLLICVPVARCFDAGARYRLSAVEAFPNVFPRRISCGIPKHSFAGWRDTLIRRRHGAMLVKCWGSNRSHPQRRRSRVVLANFCLIWIPPLSGLHPRRRG